MEDMQISPNAYIRAQEDKLNELFRELLFSNAKNRDLLEENRQLKKQLKANEDVGNNKGNN